MRFALARTRGVAQPSARVGGVDGGSGKLASVFGVVCIGARRCPHECGSGIVSINYAFVALTRAAQYRAAFSVQRAATASLNNEGRHRREAWRTSRNPRLSPNSE